MASETRSLDSTEGGIGFLRERLILICKVFAFIDIVYYSLFALALSLDSKIGFLALLGQSFSLETLGEYVLFACVALSARFTTSLRVLRVLDAVLMIGLGCLWSSWCFMHPYPALGAYEMTLALVACPVLRAVLVPSSGLRTFAITVAACAPGIAASFVAARLRGSSMMTPAALTTLVVNWCALSAAFATVASSVVYGLRSEVRKARCLGQYTLLERIGQGGMGVVYLAQHAFLRRRTVVKVVGEGASPEMLDRFEREAQLTSQLTHPNTIAIYDFGRTKDGSFYYAMEHLEGMDLERLVDAAGPFPAARAIHVLRQICGALEEAHALGLLHRDIKPSNVFLCPKRGPADVVKVLDFGLVKDLRGLEASPALTQKNAFMGTPLYMSPELIYARSDVDGRSDIYAIGAVGYYLLCGEPPFEGRSALEVCSKHLFSAPAPPSARSNTRLPADLESVILRCLQKDPEARYPDVRALAAALNGCSDASSWAEADANAWWAQRRAELDALEGRKTGSLPSTIAVNLSNRWSDAAHHAPPVASASA